MPYPGSARKTTNNTPPPPCFKSFIKAAFSIVLPPLAVLLLAADSIVAEDFGANEGALGEESAVSSAGADSSGAANQAKSGKKKSKQSYPYIGFEFGGGFKVGGDYYDAIGDFYKDYMDADSSGGGAMLEFQAALPIAVHKNVMVKPKLSYLMSFIGYKECNGFFCETKNYTDTITTLSMAGEYYLNGVKTSTPFLGAEIGKSSPSAGKSEWYDFESDGMSWGAYIGYNAHNGNFSGSLSIGWRSIPVKMIESPGNYERRSSKNFGGVTLIATFRFFPN